MKDKRLGGDNMAPSGLYARLCHAFLVLFLLLYEDYGSADFKDYSTTTVPFYGSKVIKEQ